MCIVTVYLGGFLLRLARSTHAAVLASAGQLLLLLLLAYVHRPEQVLHLLYLEVVAQARDSSRRQRRQLTARRTRQLTCMQSCTDWTSQPSFKNDKSS